MKKITLAFVSLCIACNIHAQCTIDYTQTNPGVYPDTLPVGTVSQPYNQDITFVLITDTLGFTITNFNIANIVGLPVGITWQCNNFANGCNYNPATSLYGCVNLSGTPLVAGTYTATVTVVATIQLLGNQSINYSVPIVILPASVSNPGFSMTNSIGCEPLTVSFVNNNPGQASYLWDFGNGIQSTLENPPSQTYNTPGDYVVTQTAIPNGIPQYFLTSITVTSIPNNYGAPLDVPDMYFFIYDSAGAQIYDSHPAILNTNPPYTWTLPNIPLQDGNYTIHVWDEDGGLFGADDDLASVTFPGWSNGGTATGTLSGVSGSLNVNYNILVIPVNPLTATDTIHVYGNPQTPTIAASGNLVFCDGDSVELVCSDSTDIQWYEGSTLLSGENGQTLWVNVSGSYSVISTNAFGCTAQSVPTVVTVNANPPKPNFYVTGNTLNCVVTGYELQWYFNNTVIAGATALTYNATNAGTYFVVATDSVTGCSTISDSLQFIPVSFEQLTQLPVNLSIAPNPSNGSMKLTIESAMKANAELNVTDVAGKQMYIQALKLNAGIHYVNLDLTSFGQGIYFVKVKANGFEKTMRCVVLK